MVEARVTKYEAGYYLDYIKLAGKRHEQFEPLFSDLYRMADFVNMWLQEKGVFAHQYELIITHHE